MKQLTVFFSLILFFFFNANSQTGTDITQTWKEFSGKKYAIQYPEAWRMDTSGIMGVDAFFFSPRVSQEDKFSENVNVMIQDLTGMGITLDKYVENSENQIRNLVTNSTLIESKRMSKNGMEYQQVLYTGKQGIFDLKTLQHYFIIGEKAYVVTFVAEANQYDQYETTAWKILDSFKLFL